MEGICRVVSLISAGHLMLPSFIILFHIHWRYYMKCSGMLGRHKVVPHRKMAIQSREWPLCRLLNNLSCGLAWKGESDILHWNLNIRIERIYQLASEETKGGARHVESKNHSNSRTSPLPTSFFINVHTICYLDNGVKRGGNPVQPSHTGCQTGGLLGEIQVLWNQKHI